MNKRLSFILVTFLVVFGSCRNTNDLPILSKQKEVGGKMEYESIPPFEFIDQDSQRITNQHFKDKAYVADFFFTSCPTICPIMQKHMLEIQNTFLEEPTLKLMSHTIDPKRDTVERLKSYALNLGAKNGKWHFVTGNKDDLYEIADDYFNVVVEDPNLPDGFDHSGRFVLVDPQGHIRAYCNGTNEEEVEKFIAKIYLLLDEIKSRS
jgi:protein SCO1/2